jgi:hypothetical protein
MCGDMEQMIAATANLKSLHFADSGKAVGGGQHGDIKENLLLTEASAQAPGCSVDQNEDPTVKDPRVLSCAVNVSASLDTFQSVFTTAASDLGACMSRLKWTPGDKSEHCALAPGGLGCYYDWSKDGRDVELFGYWSSDPQILGLGVYASIPDKR